MGKHLLGLVWGLPASFSLPSLASCRRALAKIGPPIGDRMARGSRLERAADYRVHAWPGHVSN